MRLIQLSSALDASRNTVVDLGEGQAIETREVIRGDRQIVYLSSQTACSQGCTICHLTSTRQTVGRDLTPQEIGEQAVLFPRRPETKRMHYNFMARGEFFSNKHLTHGRVADQLVGSLSRSGAHVLISTIMPKTLSRPLSALFPQHFPDIYYSLYTADEDKHHSMFPAAMPPAAALDRLRTWQLHSGKLVRIHLPLIAGFNDTPGDWNRLRRLVDEAELKVEFNLIAYNPPDTSTAEADYDAYYRARASLRAHSVARVGTDVFAACGMFYAA